MGEDLQLPMGEQLNSTSHFSDHSAAFSWCFSTLGCSELSLLQQVRIAEKWGVPRLEVRGVGGKIDLPDYANQFAWSARNEPTCMGSTDVKVWSQGSSLRLSDEAAVLLNGLLEYVPWLSFFDSRYLRVFDGELAPGRKGIEEAWRRFDQWEAWRERYGWSFSIIIETHSRFYREDDVARLFANKHPNVHLLWDAHNTWKASGVCPLATWNAVKPWTTHIHVKDSIEIAGDVHPYTYVVPPQGTFPLKELLGTLESDKFDGTVSLEWERHWHPELPDINTALKGLARMLP